MPPQRSAGSPLKPLRRSASFFKVHKQRSNQAQRDFDSSEASRLDDQGTIHSLAHTVQARDVPQIMQYVLDHMFETIPERSGMSSALVADVLCFRRSIPALVSVSHIHALSKAPTTTEREIATLLKEGVVRRLNVSGRGLGSTDISEFLVTHENWKQAVLSSPRISPELKGQSMFQYHRRNI